IVDDARPPRSAETRFEAVIVMPPAVWSADLDIDKALRRIPDGDLGAPVDAQAMDADLVVDERARAHADRARREDAEVHPRRGETLEIGRVGEEGEGVVERAWDDGLTMQAGESVVGASGDRIHVG